MENQTIVPPTDLSAQLAAVLANQLAPKPEPKPEPQKDDKAPKVIPETEYLALKKQNEEILSKLAEYDAKKAMLEEEKLRKEKEKLEQAEKENNFKALAELRQKELDRLAAEKAELEKALAEQNGLKESANKFQELIKITVENKLKALPEKELNAVKALSAWNDADPAAQLKALEDYEKLKPLSQGNKPVFHNGTPGQMNISSYEAAKQKGDVTGMLRAKMAQA